MSVSHLEGAVSDWFVTSAILRLILSYDVKDHDIVSVLESISSHADENRVAPFEFSQLISSKSAGIDHSADFEVYSNCQVGGSYDGWSLAEVRCSFLCALRRSVTCCEQGCYIRVNVLEANPYGGRWSLCPVYLSGEASSLCGNSGHSSVQGQPSVWEMREYSHFNVYQVAA